MSGHICQLSHQRVLKPDAVRLLDAQCLRLHDEQKLAGYLDRLQHIAGNKPFVLSEYGIDTIREGEAEQWRLTQMHLQCGFRHGLAGAFIFVYTNDWFTGGHLIDDWAFGVT